MKRNKILNKVFQGKLDVDTAYMCLFKDEESHLVKKVRKLKKAKFIKIKFSFSENRRVGYFLNTIFLLPAPVFLLRKFTKHIETKDFQLENFLYKGLSISVMSKKVNLLIKTL